MNETIRRLAHILAERTPELRREFEVAWLGSSGAPCAPDRAGGSFTPGRGSGGSGGTGEVSPAPLPSKNKKFSAAEISVAVGAASAHKLED